MVLFLLECIKQSHIKPVNNNKLTNIEDPSENPTIFSKRFQEALGKHTTLNPDSSEGELVLNVKFITQSAPDIR